MPPASGYGVEILYFVYTFHGRGHCWNCEKYGDVGGEGDRGCDAEFDDDKETKTLLSCRLIDDPKILSERIINGNNEDCGFHLLR